MDFDKLKTASNLLLTSFLFQEDEIDSKKQKKRFWVHPYLRKRNESGAFVSVFGEIEAISDPLLFLKYLRTTSAQLEELLLLVGPQIKKEYVTREPICPKMRLVITLR